MRVKDCNSIVHGKMVARYSIVLKLIVFHMLVAWCSAKHVSMPRVQQISGEQRVQETIENLIHTGIYSHRDLDASQVQVVRPVRVTRDGALVSRAVEHAHAHGHPRARRDLARNEHLMEHSLHYNITVDGRDLRLDLRPSVSFITPALVVERRRAGERTRSQPHPSATACHYVGAVRGQPASRVALSACDGLAGHLITEHGEFWIEPSNQAHNVSEGRSHVIFKRSAMDKIKAFHRRTKRETNINENIRTVKGRNSHERRQRQYTRNRDPRRSRESTEAMEQRKRKHLEDLRRLAELRNNPTEYRRRQANLRMQQRNHSGLSSLTNPIVSSSRSSEVSKSHESSNDRSRNRNISRNDRRQRRKHKRRRGRREKNCATIQPPYQWNSTNSHAIDEKNKSRINEQNRRYQHYHQPHRHRFNVTRRARRSVSKPQHVEVLLVADKSMTDFHEKGLLEVYLLTIMNMVSSLYMDPSIGNYIKVVVVKIILVEELEAEPDLNVSRNADSTLSSFCRWQQMQNPDGDEDPYHHDVAILVTRQDICSLHDTPCSTLGVAHVAGMCQPDRSCSVNEDNGIMLAHTITHELGHNFGLYHDTEKIGCHRREGSTLHIMTPYFEADTVQVAWSRCSKRDVTMFLDAGMGECLGDQPTQEYMYPEMPAGAMFDAEVQCRLQFGVEAEVCSEPARMCEQLWCVLNGTCKSMLRPPATGTACGTDMWCQNQKCVPRAPSPAPLDGGWGEWTEWSECSRTCGAGVSTQSRECNNPKPGNKGSYCIGDRSRYKICNTDPCPINVPSFREVQCSKYNNNMMLNNETVTQWIPYYDQDKPCELQCVPRDADDDSGVIASVVADGTPCRQLPGFRDLCIAGVCYKVGCDWIVDSEVEEDECGVCGGNGSACKTVQGIYTKGTTHQTGFSEVAVIPAGSRNVKIQEKVNPGNYISIGSAKSRKVYFNGARKETLIEYSVAGSQAIYERNRDWEKVQIPGPIGEDIKVYQRIFRGKHRNPGVTYQYTVDRQRAARRYRYRLTEWTPCSATCGRGYMRRYHECVDQNQRIVEQSQCYHIEPPRNEALIQHCQARECAAARDRPAARAPTAAVHAAPTAAMRAAPTAAMHAAPTAATHWWVGAWNPCNKACHMPGEQATKHRSIYCVDKMSNAVVNDSECDYTTKPLTTILCADIPAC